jgi:molecular chaperone GrpE
MTPDAVTDAPTETAPEPPNPESSGLAPEAGLDVQLADANARAAKAEARVQELQDKLLRSAAEFENQRRRITRERDETVKAGNERLLRDFIPVVDNLERAVATAGDVEAVRDGIRLVLKQFADTLDRHGVTSFSAVGAKFDPTRHEALMQQETTEVPADHVVSEFARGYLLNDRLVRPATVVVARAP